MSLLVSRYAEPLYLAAKETGELETVTADMAALGMLLASGESGKVFAEYLLSPQVSRKEKLDTLLAVFASGSKITRNFFQVVIERGREELLLELPDEFLKRMKKEAGIVSANLISSIALTEEHLKAMAEKIGKSIHKQVELTSETDASLLGGSILELEGKRYDASLKRQLDDLKQALLV